jgi:transposase
MANCLTMATIDTILTLHKSGHSNREIARLTGVHRETVGKYVAERGGENRPNPHTGSANHESLLKSSQPLPKCPPASCTLRRQ